MPRIRPINAQQGHSNGQGLSIAKQGDGYYTGPRVVLSQIPLTVAAIAGVSSEKTDDANPD